MRLLKRSNYDLCDASSAVMPATVLPPRTDAPRIRGLVSWTMVLAFAMLNASTSYSADPGRGRALYENHCEYCHTSKLHARPNKLPLTMNELRLIIDNWQHQEKLSWMSEEVEDVVEYLNLTRYHFAPN